MHKSVKDSVKRLNGKISATAKTPLLKAIASVEMDGPLYYRYWVENMDMSDLEHVCWKHKDALINDRMAFRKTLKEFVNAVLHDIGWSTRHFTPFTPGTMNYKEWGAGKSAILSLDGIQAVIDLVGAVENDEYEFIEIPDPLGETCIISLQDPNPSNPTIFRTDHETYYSPIEKSQTKFSEYLDEFITLDDVLDDLEELCNKLYKEDIEGIFDDTESVKTNSSAGDGDASDSEEYEEIEIYEDDIENLFVEIENTLLVNSDLSDAKRKLIATEIVKSFCHLLDEKAGTELEAEVKKLAKAVY